LPGNVGRHVLDSVRGSEDGCAVRLPHSDIIDIDCSGGALVREGKDAKTLDPRAGLNANSSGGFPDRRSIVFKRKVSDIFLGDKGFTRIVRLYFV
jgi:hypothetical protein